MSRPLTPVTQACDDFLSYHSKILCPAASDFFCDLDKDSLSLHQAFAINMLAAHAMDYLHAVRVAQGQKISRLDLFQQFDENHSVEGAALANRKFELVNLLNNSLKHVELDGRRKANKMAIERYGPIRFGNLVESEGRIYCLLQQYRFDFGRVVLRTVLNPLTRIIFSNEEDVVDFASGEWIWEEGNGFDEDDPIDQMIEHCNPACANCGESESECECATFVFDGEAGRFEPLRSNEHLFDFNTVMSKISGAYNPND